MPEHKERILIVDDVPHNCALLATMLGDAYDTVIAHSGDEALERLAASSNGTLPDLVLLDIMMPGIDGYEVARRIKADQATRGIPIIMVTALDDRQAKQASLEAGAEEFLGKPIDRIELLARVRNMLRLRQLGRELAEYNERLEKQVQVRTASLKKEIENRTLAEAEIHRLHRHDPLTQLPNHVYFREYLQTLLDQLRGTENWAVVILLALDQLPLVTQTQGRQTRDRLISEIAERLSCSELGSHFMAHMEPGIFALALGPLADPDPASLRGTINHCIHDALKMSFDLDGIVVHLTHRIGISHSSNETDTPESLTQAADMALFWSGQYGQEPVQWYSRKLEAEVRENRRNWAEMGQRIGRLSPREREVADLIVAGHASKMIAYKLGTSVRTVDAQRVRIMDKLQAASVADLVRMMMAPSAHSHSSP